MSRIALLLVAASAALVMPDRAGFGPPDAHAFAAATIGATLVLALVWSLWLLPGLSRALLALRLGFAGTPRRRVLVLAGGGFLTPAIARRTGLAQDAVRAVLHQNVVRRARGYRRKDFPAGKDDRRRGAPGRVAGEPYRLQSQALAGLAQTADPRHGACLSYAPPRSAAGAQS